MRRRLSHPRRRCARRARRPGRRARARRARERAVEVGDGRLDDRDRSSSSPASRSSSSSGPGSRATSTTSRSRRGSRCSSRRRTTTRPNGRSTRRSGDERDAERRHAASRRSSTTTTSRPTSRPQGPVETWHVLWFSLGWMYAFLVALVDRPAALGGAVPLDAPALAALPGRPLGRLHDRVRAAGRDDVLRRDDGALVRDLPRARDRAPRLGAALLMAATSPDEFLAAAPPFVSYSSCTEVVVPAAAWEVVYASLQALKGHVQEYPGCQRFDVFVRAEDDGVPHPRLHDLGHARPARGLRGARLHRSSACSPTSGDRAGTGADHGEDLLMGRPPHAAAGTAARRATATGPSRRPPSPGARSPRVGDPGDPRRRLPRVHAAGLLPRARPPLGGRLRRRVDPALHDGRVLRRATFLTSRSSS